MVIRNNNEVTPDIRKLNFQLTGLSNLIQGAGGLQDQISQNSQAIGNLLTTQANIPAYPTANLLWNGEMGHSINSWFDIAYVVADKARECAFWYSHNAPAEARTFTSSDVNTGADTIAIIGHEFTTGCAVDLLILGGGVLPAPLAILTTYFVIYVTANTISLATTVVNAYAGTAINLTTAGTAAQTFTIQQQLISTDARTSSTNNELKNILHSTYTGRYSRWNSINGYAEMNGTTSVAEIMPSNMIDATTPLARISLIAAKANQYIEIPDACLFGAGVWDNTSGQRKFLTGDIGFSAALSGTPGTVERRYRALLSSDRGFQLLSSEITIANGPSDAQFSSTRNILLSWLQQAGQLQVELYEYLPLGGDGASAPQYRLITVVSSATSHIYQGAFQAVVSGYPTPTETVRSATFFTATGELADLNTNAVDTQWSTVNFPIGVPNNYNKGNTTDRQWVVLWMTVAPNIYIPSGVTTDGTTTITIPTGIINSAAIASGGYGTGGGSLYVPLEVEVYDSAGSLVGTLNITSVTSDTAIVVSGAVAAGSNRQLRIVGGGFHGVYIDKIHLGYQQNTSYAPNANDVRTLQPVAAPANSDQGGVGTGGSGGGIDHCVATGWPVKLHLGIWKEIQTTRPGQKWAAGHMTPNLLIKLKPGVDNVRLIRAANGVELACTDTECFTVETDQGRPVPLSRLRVGDPIVTEIDDRIEMSTVAEITGYLGITEVFTPSLNNNHLFIAGRLRLSLWQRITNRIRGNRKQKGGFVLHNLKPIEVPL